MTFAAITDQDPGLLALVDQMRSFIAEYPNAAPLLRDATTELTRSTPYPELVVETVVETVVDDGESFTALRCPWCGALTSDDDQDGLIVIDTDDRWTKVQPDEHDFERGSITPHYDGGSGEFQSLHYLHGSCGRPIDLPEGWVER